MRRFLIAAVCSISFFVFCSFATGASKDKWNEHKGRHFIIYYRDTPFDFIQSVEDAAEQYYEEITRDLGFTRYEGWSWDRRAKIYIYRDAKDYVQSARQAGWSHGAASTREKIIMTFPSAHGFFDSTLPHELGHIIFREFVGYKAKIPLWLEEGVAMYQEKAKRWGAANVVRDAIHNGKFISLKELSRMRLRRDTDKEVVDLFYAESASIVYYMITEFGQHRFVNFCRQLKKGKHFETALNNAYVRFRNIDALNDAWKKHLQ